MGAKLCQDRLAEDAVQRLGKQGLKPRAIHPVLVFAVH
jgi:predicted short-subunit dehydrogenase-like oxidoreductase (DUF2520 family)